MILFMCFSSKIHIYVLTKRLLIYKDGRQRSVIYFFYQTSKEGHMIGTMAVSHPGHVGPTPSPAQVVFGSLVEIIVIPRSALDGPLDLTKGWRLFQDVIIRIVLEYTAIQCYIE